MNYIITAKSNKPGGPIQFVQSTRYRSLTSDVNEAARFVQAGSALEAIEGLITRNFENDNDVVLGYALIKTVFVEEFIVPKKKAKKGFVIKTNNQAQPYSKAPRKPKQLDFSHVKYCLTPNIDKATRFATREEAQKRIDDSLAVLKAVAAEMNQEVYAQTAANFKAEIIEV
jgi:hypothetical protein